MSSNPFRRQINAESPQSSVPANPAPAPPASQPLSINTGTRPGKHVRIASPPDTAISPASYPSSPEFARLSPSPQPTVIPYTFDAAPRISVGDPFSAADSSADEDEAVSEALRNTRSNIAASRNPPAPAPASSEDAVHNTLSKFASRPRDGKPPFTQGTVEASKQDSKRQTMDVDAFTRLLLSGGGNVPSTGGTSIASTAGPTNTLSESSSTADSASISHQSLFEPMPPITAESPRTSHELDENEAVSARRAITPIESAGAVKKPPPAPRPRHGKPIKAPQQTVVVPMEKKSSSSEAAIPVSPEPRSPVFDLNKPLPPPPAFDSSRRSSSNSIVGSDPPMQFKRPPTPPLSRRRSHGPSKPPLSRNSPSSQSITLSQSPSSSSSLPTAPKAPPPPPSRRASQRASETPNLSNLPSTSEEADSDASGPDLSQPIIPHNALTRTTSTTTRASVLSESAAPPPPPPPRRHRGSSNASQRPIIGGPLAGSSRSSIDAKGPSLPADAGRKVSEGSSSRDILKDLASLQAEVDALRRQGMRE